MRITTVKAKKVMKFTTNATLKDLDKYTGTKPSELYAEAQRCGYQTMEPQIWQYTGPDGKPDTVFKLEIMLPIIGDGNGLKPEGFEIGEAKEFKALQTLHLNKAEVIKQAFIATAVAGLLMLSFLFFNDIVFDLLGIELESFKVAGGVILFILGLQIVLGLDIGVTSL